ncbi:hypothetical protein [Anabaena azotica]|uniref:Uncharacterized protein n=1 Tax=Anabaena azotica FACHB-119 TaxID=947527 RepID=A0ABR8D905_9NOST|nr:hypothetical protein [Anabaena azotica]MBD2503416.1 hypothetical protein [Anabaena azotica FACHB-119]
MAAAVQTTATTLEGQLFEVANRVQLAELSQPADARPNNVQVALDPEGGTVSITFSAPASFTIGAAGQLVATPVAYLP